MIFSLSITEAPYSHQAATTAYHFAKAALGKGHSIYRVFFSNNGVHSGSALACPPEAEINISKQWLELAKGHNIDLVVCVAAALRRGILDADEAKRQGKANGNLAKGYTISGLGQLVEAGIESDRLISFGG